MPSSKSTTAQITEPCAMLEACSHIDAKLLELNGNSAQFRLSEESAFIEAMNQEMTGKLFNGNVIRPENFLWSGYPLQLHHCRQRRQRDPGWRHRLR